MIKTPAYTHLTHTKKRLLEILPTLNKSIIHYRLIDAFKTAEYLLQNNIPVSEKDYDQWGLLTLINASLDLFGNDPISEYLQDLAAECVYYLTDEKTGFLNPSS